MSRVCIMYRSVRRYLPFWCTGAVGACSWLDECDADGRQLQIEWLGIIVNCEFARRSDGSIAHSDAVFAPVIPARLNEATGTWEPTI